MANFASLRGPVGLNRVYARVPDGPLRIDPWLKSLKHGSTFATNGPLLGFAIGGTELGDDVKLPSERKVKFNAWLWSFVPVDHLDDCNGKVAQDLKLSPDRQSSDAEGEIFLSQSGGGACCALSAIKRNIPFSMPILTPQPVRSTQVLPRHRRVRQTMPPTS